MIGKKTTGFCPDAEGQSIEENLRAAIVSALDGAEADWLKVNLNINRENYPTATVLHIRVKAENQAKRRGSDFDWSLKLRRMQAIVAALGWRECAHWENHDEFYLRICRPNRQK